MKFGSTVLFVDNVETVMEFYQSAFGFERKFYDPAFGFGELTIGGGSIGIASHGAGEQMMPGRFQTPASGNPDGVEIALYTSDVDEAFKRAVKAGAAPLAEPKLMEWGQTVAYVKSIEGTVIGLCTELPSQS